VPTYVSVPHALSHAVAGFADCGGTHEEKDGGAITIEGENERGMVKGVTMRTSDMPTMALPDRRIWGRAPFGQRLPAACENRGTRRTDRTQTRRRLATRRELSIEAANRNTGTAEGKRFASFDVGLRSRACMSRQRAITASQRARCRETLLSIGLSASPQTFASVFAPKRDLRCDRSWHTSPQRHLPRQ